MSVEQRNTSLEFTRTKNQYFKIGKKCLVTYLGYDQVSGFYNFTVAVNKNSEPYSKRIGDVISISKKFQVKVIGFSEKTGRVELRVTAPSNVKIDRG